MTNAPRNARGRICRPGIVNINNEISTGDVGCLEAQCLEVLLGGTLFLIFDVEIFVRLDVILEFHPLKVL